MQKSKKERLSRAAERRSHRPASIDVSQLYSIDECAAALDRSRAGIYNDIAAGRIRAVKDGARRKISGAEIIRISCELIERTHTTRQ